MLLMVINSRTSAKSKYGTIRRQANYVFGEGSPEDLLILL
jgi:hypothetical protein